MRWSVWFVVGFGVVYVATFGALYPHLGDATLALSVIPLIVAAWTHGLRAGIVASAAMIVINLTLMQTLGGLDGFRLPQIPRIIVAATIGIGAGWAGDITRRQRELLARNRSMTDELRANQQALERAVAERTAELVRANESLVAETAARRDADARAATADRLAVIGTLTAGIGHEINNPLAVVSANLEFVEESLPAPPPMVAEALADARSAARRAAEIVRHMRVFIQANVSAERADVRSVIESTVRMVAHHIRHRAKLEIDIADTVAAVALAPAHLGQILLNLLLNASQALSERSPRDNFVRIRVRTLATNRVTIEVTDSGSGISAGVQERLFEPFFSTKPGIGTGLGLWVSHQIVAAAGGTISVSSSDTGTTFHIELPVAPDDDKSVDDDEALIGAAPAIRRVKLFVIDDDLEVGRAIDRLMAGRHDLVVQPDAQQALVEITAGARFDVILCDVMMPGLNGVDFFARLQEIAPDQAERVVFMTGGAFIERANDFIHEGHRRVLAKPFEAELLEAAIRDVIKPATSVDQTAGSK